MVVKSSFPSEVKGIAKLSGENLIFAEEICIEESDETETRYLAFEKTKLNDLISEDELTKERED